MANFNKKNLTTCTNIHEIVSWYTVNKVTDSGWSSTNDQVQIWADVINKSKRANCIDTAINTTCLLRDNHICSYILIITMHVNETSKPSHWIPVQEHDGIVTIFNYIHPTLYKVTTTRTLKSGIDIMLHWMRENYEKDFHVKLQDITCDIVPMSRINEIYRYYKQRKKVNQLDIMSICNYAIRG